MTYLFHINIFIGRIEINFVIIAALHGCFWNEDNYLNAFSQEIKFAIKKAIRHNYSGFLKVLSLHGCEKQFQNTFFKKAHFI